MVDTRDVIAPQSYPTSNESIADVQADKSIWGTAFELENPVYNFIDWLERPTFDPDPDYTVERFLEQRNQTPFFAEHRTRFYGVRSAEEFDYVKGKVEKEIADRQFLASQGWAGIGAAMVAGVLSPTMLIPAFGQVKGVSAIYSGMGYGMLAGGLDEIPLQLNQSTRTVGDAALAVGTATMVGGLLGTAATYFRGVPDLEADMAGRPSRVYVTNTAPQGFGGSVGAKVAFNDPGRLKGGKIVGKAAEWTGPVGRAVGQKITDIEGSAVHRNFMAQMGHGGLDFEAAQDGLTSTGGRGTIEDRVTTYDVYDLTTNTHLSEGYASYMEAPEGAFRETRARLKSVGGKKQGKLNYREFREEVYKALVSGDEHHIPQVKSAAAALRSSVIDPLIKGAVDSGAMKEFGDLVGDESYFHRVWDAVKVANTPGLVDRLARDFEAKLAERFHTKANKLKGRVERLEEIARELEMTTEQAKALRALVKAERNKFKEENIEFLRLQEQVRALKAQRAGLNTRIRNLEAKNGETAGARQQLDLLNQQIDALEATEGFKPFLIKKGKYNVRINRLNKIRSGEGLAEAVRYREGITASRDRLAEQARLAGSDDFDLETGVGTFREQAYSDAQDVVQKLKRSGPRLPQFEAVQGDRGLEHARVLDVNSLDYLDVLETDPHIVVRRMIRTLAPDTEIAKRWGDKRATSYFDGLEQEELTKRQNIEKRDWDEGKKAKALDKLDKQYKQFRNDAVAVIDRLRHTRGLPDNPDSYLERAGRVAMGLNTMRFMGSVVPSSVADLGRIIFKHGFGRVFKYALRPMLADWKTFKMSAMEARYAGNALDPLNHKRALAITDILTDHHHRTGFERAVDYGASRVGIIAGFDFWTAGMKMLDAAVVNGRIMENIAALQKAKVKKKVMLPDADGNMVEVVQESVPERLTKRAQAARQWLAENEIDGVLADRIWKEMNGADEGGGLVNNVWLPNTESWVDPETVMAYRAALNRQIDSTIITPGIERPLMTDASTLARMAFQFKSFVFSSTTRTTLAGLQQRDAAAVQGVITSLLLGAFSYWLYTRSIGKPEDFDNASYDKLMDEAIDRSGLLGVISLVQQATQRIPAVAPYTSFQGQRTTRRAGQDLLDIAVGPSYNLAETIGNVLVGLDEPTESTLHKLRLLLPYQNVFYLRRIVDQLEEATAETLDLPEKRR